MSFRLYIIVRMHNCREFFIDWIEQLYSSNTLCKYHILTKCTSVGCIYLQFYWTSHCVVDEDTPRILADTLYVKTIKTWNALRVITVGNVWQSAPLQHLAILNKSSKLKIGSFENLKGIAHAVTKICPHLCHFQNYTYGHVICQPI